MLLRDRFDGRRALELGLATEVVPVGTALERALELGESLAQLPPLAVAVTKEAADLLPETSREAGLLIERLAYAALVQSPDLRTRQPGPGRG
jgi:enoyl-CoA hydratase/carnithine racemase